MKLPLWVRDEETEKFTNTKTKNQNRKLCENYGIEGFSQKRSTRLLDMNKTRLFGLLDTIFMFHH